MIHKLTQESKKLFSSFFRSLLVKSIEDIQMSKAAIAKRKAFFKTNLELEVDRLGNFTNYQLRLLAEASLIVELYGHIRFNIKSDNWQGQTAQYGGVIDEYDLEVQVFKKLSFEEVQDYKNKQQGILNFMEEFEFAAPPAALITDKKTGELVEYLRDISDLKIDIKVGKVHLVLPKHLNQAFVASLYEMLGDFNLNSVPSDLNVSSGKKPATYAFYSNVLVELLPFIEEIIIGSGKSASNARFIAGLVFVSLNQVMDRSVYEDPRAKYKKGRKQLTIDYYSYLAKTIRNFGARPTAQNLPKNS